jgi:hypothetical protein
MRKKEKERERGMYMHVENLNNIGLLHRIKIYGTFHLKIAKKKKFTYYSRSFRALTKTDDILCYKTSVNEVKIILS